jgi:hypothetical protein
MFVSSRNTLKSFRRPIQEWEIIGVISLREIAEFTVNAAMNVCCYNSQFFKFLGHSMRGG